MTEAAEALATEETTEKTRVQKLDEQRNTYLTKVNQLCAQVGFRKFRIREMTELNKKDLRQIEKVDEEIGKLTKQIEEAQLQEAKKSEGNE